MTEEQRKRVCDNEGLIYRCMIELNIPKERWDDYYGVGAVALCKAALKEVRKEYRFSTLAVKIIRDDIVSEMRKEHAVKRGRNVMTVPMHMIENIGCGRDYEAISIGHYMAEAFIKLLSEREARVLHMLLECMTYAEIAAAEQVCRSRIQQIVKGIRKKYLDNADRDVSEGGRG